MTSSGYRPLARQLHVRALQNERVWHVAVDWDHELADEPVRLYSEVHGSDELRKVEIYRDGRMDFAGPEGHTGTTTLSWEMPDIEQVNCQPEFRARTISGREFEAIYRQALQQHGLWCCNRVARSSAARAYLNAAWPDVGNQPRARLPRLRRMQPLYEVTLSRPWHWGIAVVSAQGAAVPEALDKSLVTATAEALVIKVRHAQDVDAEVFEGDWDWATATIRVRSLTDFEETAGSVIYEGLLRLPNGRLVIGDADSEMTLNDLDEQTRVRVHAAGPTDTGATDVRIDLAPRAQ